MYIGGFETHAIQGLAEACVQSPSATNLFIPSLFDPPSSGSGISGVINQVASLSLFSGSGQKSSPHALSILARVAKDPAFAPSAIGLPAGQGESSVDKVAKVCEEKLMKLLDEWTVLPDREDLLKKVKEVIWMNSVIYAVGGWGGRNKSTDESKEFNADFFS